MVQQGQPLPPADYAALNNANQNLIVALDTYTVQLPRVLAELQSAVGLREQHANEFAALRQQLQQETQAQIADMQQNLQHMQQNMTDMQQNMADMQQNMADMQQHMNSRFDMMDHKIKITDIKAHNRTLNITQPLQPLPNQAGVIPPNFPVNHTAIGSLTGPLLDDLLGFYGIPVQGVDDDKMRALASHIGREW